MLFKNVLQFRMDPRVITAVRFIKFDHIIHLQIQDGVLQPKGNINQTTLSWRKVDEYKAGSTGIKDVDYHMLTWEERGMDLDDVQSTKPNHVMTGVRFRKIGTHLNLEIKITPFNFSTGLLIQPDERSEWISNDNTDGAAQSPRTEVRLNKPGIPTKYNGNKPVSHHDQFLRFVNTDIEKDVAQHTVPFIDTQTVGPQPPTPLTGAGVMLRSTTGSGGYIAPKIYTYDLSQHLQEDFEKPDLTTRIKYEL